MILTLQLLDLVDHNILGSIKNIFVCIIQLYEVKILLYIRIIILVFDKHVIVY